MMNNLFNGMFGKVEPGMCRLSTSGNVAVKTSNGYKAYNVKKKRLVNCGNFIFNIGEDFFYLIPTSKVEIGDIIIHNGRPACVVDVSNDDIEVINYETSTKERIIPERHVFMGSTYFYGKIMSLFGSTIKSGKGMRKMMEMAMMSSMFGGGMNPFSGDGGNGTVGTGAVNNGQNMSNMFPFLMMMNGGMSDMFDGILGDDSEILPFSFGDGDEDDSDGSEEDDE